MQRREGQILHILEREAHAMQRTFYETNSSHQKKQILMMRNSFKGFLRGLDIPRKEMIHGA